MITLHACLAAGIMASTCYAPPLPPSLPAYATQQWIHYAASIVAGETVPDCEICDRWIACTIKRDIEGDQDNEGKHHPWELHPDRWHAYRAPRPQHLAAVEAALQEQGCLNVPACAYLGSLNDYRYWSAGRLAQDVSCHLVGNHHGAIVCVPPANLPASAQAGPATPSPAPSTSSTTNTTPRRPASPGPAEPRPQDHACE